MNDNNVVKENVADKRIFGTILYDFMCHGYNVVATHYEDNVQYFRIDDKKLNCFTFVLRRGACAGVEGFWLDVMVTPKVDAHIINTLLFNNPYKLFVKIDYCDDSQNNKFDIFYSFYNVSKFIKNIRKHNRFIRWIQMVSADEPIKIKSILR